MTDSSMNRYKILCLGDVVGPEAVDCLSKNLWNIRREFGADLVVANGENADIGNGITAASAQTLLSAGVDVITSGNHIWQKKDMRTFLDESDLILRPANYPDCNPGKGYTLVDAGGARVLVMNVQGTVFMEALSDPFGCVEKILDANRGRYDYAVLDIHAEATSEKIAIARYFDGRIHVVVGTHTHVQTADEQILPGGTGYITDLGMCGSQNGILGVATDSILARLRYKMPVKFDLAKGNVKIRGCLFGINAQNNRVEFVERAEI
ncbi:MAG: YmdB family metallophosphoesterase [Eubacteriales bacterium]